MAFQGKYENKQTNKPINKKNFKKNPVSFGLSANKNGHC